MSVTNVNDQRILLARRLFHERWVPRYYSGALHLTSVFLLLAIASAWSFSQVLSYSLYEFIWVFFFFLLNSFFVYILHRFPQHKKYKGAGLFLKLHGIHHSVFNGKSMRLSSSKDIGMVVFPFSIVLAYFLLLFAPLSLLIAKTAGTEVAYIFFAMASLYFLLHESIHFLDHGLVSQNIKNWAPLKKLTEHHRKHHSTEYPPCNFGVVVPMWDYIFGTKL